MSTPVTQTPTLPSSVYRKPVHSLLRSVAKGTPFRTPDRRRFGPLGSTRKHTQTRHHAAYRSTRGPGETPLSQRFRDNNTPNVTNVELDEKVENNLKELMKKTWHVFRLTPLYNFKKKKADFQRYSRSLSACIAAEIKKGVFVDTSVPDDAIIGNFSGLDTGSEDPTALLIEIRGKTKKNTVPLPVICQAVLFSTDLEYNPIQASLQDSFTYYSTMLIHGTQILSSTVQGWLEEQFDCLVIQHTFMPHELAFMTAMFTGFEENHKPLDLVYAVPGEVEGLDKISYTTRADDCLQLWNSVRSSDEDCFTSEEAGLFIAGLESHFFEVFNIRLSAMQLITTETSVALVSKDGKIKLHTKSTENVLKVCRHLTDLALDKLIVS